MDKIADNTPPKIGRKKGETIWLMKEHQRWLGGWENEKKRERERVRVGDIGGIRTNNLGGT